MTYIYEHAQIENFENQILAGKITPQQIEQMISEGTLTEAQMKVVEELAPVLGGLKNAAYSVGRGIRNTLGQAKNKVQQGVQNAKTAYSQGVQQTQASNAQEMQARQWQNIDATITNTRIREKLDALAKSFPNDQFMQQAAQYVNTIFQEIQVHLAENYPHMKVSAPQGYQSPMQKSIDRQGDISASQMNRRYRQDLRNEPPQNRRQSRIAQKVRAA